MTTTYIHTVTAIATFPYVVDFTDYCDIDRFVADANILFNETIRGVECGFCENGKYWGVIYINRKPTQAAIDHLLVKAGYIPDDLMIVD